MISIERKEGANLRRYATVYGYWNAWLLHDEFLSTETDCLFHFESHCLSQLLSSRETDAFRSLQKPADVVRIDPRRPR